MFARTQLDSATNNCEIVAFDKQTSQFAFKEPSSWALVLGPLKLFTYCAELFTNQKKR